MSAQGNYLYQAALLHFQAGDLAKAESCCRDALTGEADHAPSLHLLGLIARQAGRLADAAALIARALNYQPQVADYHANLAAVLLGLDRLAEAVTAGDAALALNPGHTDARFNRSLARLRQDASADALAGFDQVVTQRPDHADSWFHRGNALLLLGRGHDAAGSYHRAVTLDPNHFEAWINLGAALERLGDPASALACYDRVLSQNASRADAWLNRSSALAILGRLDEALDSVDRSIALRPNHATAWLNRSVIQRDQGDAAASLISLDRAEALRPDNAEICTSRGHTLLALDRTAEALACHARAVALDPASADAAYGQGIALRDSGNLPAALAALDNALHLRPDDPTARLARGMVALSLGRFAEGWRDYEARWQTAALRPEAARFDTPPWLGDVPVEGRTLLLHAEQGLGDTIQFCRYAPVAAARGARVILEVQPPLLRLLACLPGVTLLTRGAPLPPYDLHAPLMSLPLAFGTTVDTVPAAVPYLSADAGTVAAWTARLAHLPGRKVGLVWAGASRQGDRTVAAVDRRRSIDPALLEPLRRIEGVSLVSLQVGERAGAMPGLFDPSAQLTDFTDTAALVCALDLVISVDTAVAHLAGALGRPVWVLNRFDSCWRWLAGRTDSPWYPSARLFHQPVAGDWPSVVDAVCAALRQPVSR